MADSLPLSLILAWVLFTGFVGTHRRHLSQFRGVSQNFRQVLVLSSTLGWLVGLSLLAYYYVQVTWFWPFVLAALGLILGGIGFGLLEGLLSVFSLSIIGFFGWPLSAWWALSIISELRP
jgi:hypothetical protein